MNIRIFITIFFIILTLIVGVWFLMFSNRSNSPADTGGNTTLPVIALSEQNYPNDFRQLVNQHSSVEHQAVIENIHTDEYYVRTCTEAGVVSNVLILVAKYQVDSRGNNTFDPALGAMSNFESKLYQDWGKVLFPNNSIDPTLLTRFETKPISDRDVVADSYRAGVVGANQEKVFYGWLLNYVVVASSESCLLSAMEDLYHVH